MTFSPNTAQWRPCAVCGLDVTDPGVPLSPVLGVTGSIHHALGFVSVRADSALQSAWRRLPHLNALQPF